MYLIDSNIFLEILLKQENKEDCKEVLGKVAEGEIHGVVSKFTVHGIEGMLTEEPAALDKFMTNITSIVNLQISDTTIQEEKQILEIAKNSSLDFDDALQYSVAQRENIEKIISYDTDFDETDLKRVEPGELL
ncbi:MAG: type II toxin-antitoxin system VapC family toxin [Candidatus Nanohaloarchaea archaeon]